MAIRVAGVIFNILVGLGIPLGVLGWCLIKKRRYLLPFAAGVLCFLASQLLTRVPLLGWLGTQPWFIAFQYQTVPYALFLGLTAGLFEEVGRYIAFKLLRRHRAFGDAVVFGLGHGGLEAGIIGANNLVILLTRLPLLITLSPLTIPLAGVERLFALMVHVGFSVMVARAVEHRRPLGLLLAILLHAALDTGAVLLNVYTNVWLVEAYAALFGLGMLVYILRCRPKPAGIPITSETPTGNGGPT